MEGKVEYISKKDGRLHSNVNCMCIVAVYETGILLGILLDTTDM